MAQALAIFDGDLDLRGGGPRLVRGVEAAAGALYYRFSTFAGTGPDDPGEWRYDYTYGMPWRTAVFGRFFRLDETQSIVAATASRVTDISPVSAFQVQITVDSGTRRATIVVDRIQVGGVISAETVTVTVPTGSFST
jgi:hypothetical protein